MPIVANTYSECCSTNGIVCLALSCKIIPYVTDYGDKLVCDISSKAKICADFVHPVQSTGLYQGFDYCRVAKKALRAGTGAVGTGLENDKEIPGFGGW